MEAFHDALTVVKQTLVSIDTSNDTSTIAIHSDRKVNRFGDDDSISNEELSTMQRVDANVQVALNRTLQGNRNGGTEGIEFCILSRLANAGIIGDSTWSQVSAAAAASSTPAASSSTPSSTDDIVAESSVRNEKWMTPPLTRTISGDGDDMVCDDNDDDDESITPGVTTLYLIRSELGDPNDYFSVLDVSLDIESAIILYNLGIANVCLAVASNTSSQQQQQCASTAMIDPSLQYVSSVVASFEDTMVLTSHSSSATSASLCEGVAAASISSTTSSGTNNSVHAILSRASRYFKLSQSILQDLTDTNDLTNVLLGSEDDEEDNEDHTNIDNLDLALYNCMVQTETIVLRNMMWVEDILSTHYSNDHDCSNDDDDDSMNYSTANEIMSERMENLLELRYELEARTLLPNLLSPSLMNAPAA